MHYPQCFLRWSAFKCLMLMKMFLDLTSSGPGEQIKKCSKVEIPDLNVAAGLRMGCSQVCFMGCGL